MAAQSSSTPSPLLELTLTTGTGRQPGRLSSSRSCERVRVSAGQIGLVDHDNVGDFELAGLFPLQLVAGLGLYEDNDDVGDFADRRVSLSGSDGLDDDGIESEAVEQTDHEIDVGRDARLTARRGQASDEHSIVVRPVRHADAITEQSAAGERALRVACQDGDRTTGLRITSMSLPINVLLPTPPLPVTAMTRVYRALEQSAASSFSPRIVSNLCPAPPA